MVKMASERFVKEKVRRDGKSEYVDGISDITVPFAKVFNKVPLLKVTVDGKRLPDAANEVTVQTPRIAKIIYLKITPQDDFGFCKQRKFIGFFMMI